MQQLAPGDGRPCHGRNAPGAPCFGDYVKCGFNENSLFSYAHMCVYFLAIPLRVESALSLKKIPLQMGAFVVVGVVMEQQAPGCACRQSSVLRAASLPGCVCPS